MQHCGTLFDVKTAHFFCKGKAPQINCGAGSDDRAVVDGLHHDLCRYKVCIPAVTDHQGCITKLTDHTCRTVSGIQDRFNGFLRENRLIAAGAFQLGLYVFPSLF